jgi:Domain of unknown function (DUF6265)
MKYVILSMLVTANISATAQVKADLKQLDFISGKWTGSMEWGALEEYWSEPMGDNMFCAFRCVKDGKALFYEFIVIEQSESGVPTMRLRHFNRGNIAWEDKDKPYEYPLIELKEKRAVFESTDKKTRLIYERQSDNKLSAILEHEKDGKIETDSFIYSKANP